MEIIDHQANLDHLGNDSVREAYLLLVNQGEEIGLSLSATKGAVTAIRFHDFQSRYLFAFILNKNDLLFYVRKPALKIFLSSGAKVLHSFANARENPAGEITIRISSSIEAKCVADRIFTQMLSEETNSEAAITKIEKKAEKVHSDHGPMEIDIAVAKTFGDLSPGSSVTPIQSSKTPPSNEELKMSDIVIAASQVRQGSLTLFTTSIRVSELVKPGFYSVETLDPDNVNDKGYQRLLNKARAKKLADYILKGQDNQDAFLPTSVFLATDKKLEFNSNNNTIAIDSKVIGPFSVVDGQHRLEGLKMAAEKDPRVLEFEVPVNIAANLSKIAQMCHFLIVNTTQKSVDKSVEQRIIARLTEALDLEDMPSLPRWILNIVERGEIERAIRYIDYLNGTPDSPWFNKIQKANEGSDGKYVNQGSFVKSIVRYVLTANNPITILKDFDREKKIFLNYWKAIASILDNENAAVLYKYNGVELFCKFSIPFFVKLQDGGNFSVPRMTEVLQNCFDNVEGEYAGVGHPEWWASGSNASYLNSGAINVVSQELAKALHKSSMSSSFQI